MWIKCYLIAISLQISMWFFFPSTNALEFIYCLMNLKKNNLFQITKCLILKVKQSEGDIKMRDKSRKIVEWKIFCGTKKKKTTGAH